MKSDKIEKKGKEHGVKAGEKMNNKEYEKELAKLHVELVKLQEWVKYKGLKVCVVFEGRDGAGKGGVIKAITERVSPRVFRVVALPAPTEREQTQIYAQRTDCAPCYGTSNKTRLQHLSKTKARQFSVEGE